MQIPDSARVGPGLEMEVGESCGGRRQEVGTVLGSLLLAQPHQLHLQNGDKAFPS